jgi:hypothetical protein
LPLLKQALQIREEALGIDHPQYVQSQEDLALLYWKMNDIGNAYPLYKMVMEKSLDFVNTFSRP